MKYIISNEIRDIVEIKHHYFTPKWASCRVCGQNAQPLGWNAHPWVSKPQAYPPPPPPPPPTHTHTHTHTYTHIKKVVMIEPHNISRIFIYGAALLNCGIPWLFIHTYNQFMEVNSFIMETHNSMVELQKSSMRIRYSWSFRELHNQFWSSMVYFWSLTN